MSSNRPRIRFELTDGQSERVRAWARAHAEQKKHFGDSVGTYLKYDIVPSGIGDYITVICMWCEDVSINVTIDDFGEPMFDDEGNNIPWKTP